MFCALEAFLHGHVAAVVQLAGFAQRRQGFEQFGDAVFVGVCVSFGDLHLVGRCGQAKTPNGRFIPIPSLAPIRAGKLPPPRFFKQTPASVLSQCAMPSDACSCELLQGHRPVVGY